MLCLVTKLRYTEYFVIVQRIVKIQRKGSQMKMRTYVFICLEANCSFLLFFTFACGLNLNVLPPEICSIYGYEKLRYVWSLAQPISSDRKGNSSVRFFSTSGCNCHRRVFSVNEAFTTLSQKWETCAQFVPLK